MGGGEADGFYSKLLHQPFSKKPDTLVYAVDEDTEDYFGLYLNNKLILDGTISEYSPYQVLVLLQTMGLLKGDIFKTSLLFETRVEFPDNLEEY